jgi:hypothetical protein
VNLISLPCLYLNRSLIAISSQSLSHRNLNLTASIKPTVQQYMQASDQVVVRSFLYNLLPTQYNEFLCDLCSVPADFPILQAALAHIYGWHLNERNGKGTAWRRRWGLGCI